MMACWIWKDTDSANDLLETNSMVLAGTKAPGTIDMATELLGNLVIEDKAQVTGSRIFGPAIVGAGVRVTGSCIALSHPWDRFASSPTAR